MIRNTKVIYVLFFGLCIFAAASFASVLYFPDHQPLFGFMTGVAGNFSGGLLTYMQVSKHDDSK